MASSFFAGAARTAANARHAIASVAGVGGALLFIKAMPETEAQAAEFQMPEAQADSPRGAGGDSSKDQLQLVQVVFRHGARTPLCKRYWPELGPVWDVCGQAFDAVPVEVLSEQGGPRPANPDDQKQVDLKYAGGCSKGELTLVGQEQAREFGRWLRWRYSMVHGVLPDTHHEGVVHARTTNYSRTVATLQGVLSGLFPGTKQPIPVHTSAEIDEILYTNVRSCHRLHNLMAGLHKQLRDQAHQEQPPGTEAAQQQVRQALGLPSDHKVHWVDLHDAMTTMLTHKKEVPPALRDEQLLREINSHATERFMHLIAPHPDTGKHQEVLRLGLGVLMETMVRRMEAAAAAGHSSSGDATPPPPRMYLYSGHDSTLMPLLAALGKQVREWPPYMSNLVLELWRKPQGEHYIKVLYNKKELPLTELCGGAACELQQFKEHVLGAYLLTKDQHRQECLLHFLHDQPAGEHTETEEVQVGSSFHEEEKEAEGGSGGQGQKEAGGSRGMAAAAAATSGEQAAAGQKAAAGEEAAAGAAAGGEAPAARKQ